MLIVFIIQNHIENMCLKKNMTFGTFTIVSASPSIQSVKSTLHSFHSTLFTVQLGQRAVVRLIAGGA